MKTTPTRPRRTWRRAALAAAIASPALAALAVASPAGATSDTDIWIHGNPSIALTTHGLGAQVTFDSGAGTQVYYQVTTAPFVKIKITGTTDRCLEDDNTAVKVQTCATGNHAQWWLFGHGGSGCTVTSDSHGGRDWVVYTPPGPLWDDGNSTGSRLFGTLYVDGTGCN